MNHPNNIQPDPEARKLQFYLDYRWMGESDEHVRRDTEQVEDYIPSPAFQNEIEAHSDSEAQEMISRFASVEKALAEHGIEFKITNFQEYELATWQLMKIESEQN